MLNIGMFADARPVDLFLVAQWLKQPITLRAANTDELYAYYSVNSIHPSDYGDWPAPFKQTQTKRKFVNFTMQ